MRFDPKVPPFLLDLQKWFGKIETRLIRDVGAFNIPLYDSKTMAAIDKRISAGPKLSAAQRIGLYNQQYWWRLFILLQEQYPGLLRLFGYADFNHIIAEPYLLKYYPDHWSIGLIGSRLPQWVEEAYHDEDRILVLQMAILEKAYEQLWVAPHLPLLKPGERNDRLFLQPYVVLFALDADLFAIRKKLMEQEPKYWEEHDFPSIDWSDSKRYFTLHRSENALSYEEISQPEYVLLKAFEKGATIAQACALLDDDTAPHISSWFEKWAFRGWFTATTKEVFPLDWGTETSRPKSVASS